MILQEWDITLTLTEDREYLSELIRKNKYSLLNDRGIQKLLEYVRYVWVGTTGGIPGGVLFFCYYPSVNRWTFDAYKEDELLKSIDNKGNFSYRAGKLVLDWFFQQKFSETIFTMHDVTNRGATIVCKRLGFRPVECSDGFITLERRA